MGPRWCTNPKYGAMLYLSLTAGLGVYNLTTDKITDSEFTKMQGNAKKRFNSLFDLWSNGHLQCLMQVLFFSDKGKKLEEEVEETTQHIKTHFNKELKEIIQLFEKQQEFFQVHHPDSLDLVIIDMFIAGLSSRN